MLALVAVWLAIFMGYEYVTHVNVFSYMSSFHIVVDPQWKSACAERLSDWITAGVFGATLFPLFYWLLKDRKARLLGAFGIAPQV